MSFFKTQSSRAFTLVELLAVIAIIGILAAILIPVVGKVRQSARLSQCLANQRQVAAAYQLYLGDHKNMLWLQKGASTTFVQPNNGRCGTMFGQQEWDIHPGYLTVLLEPYGLRRAKWDNWQVIPDRMTTVWYCPLMASNDEIGKHGTTYRYYYPGQHAGVSDRPVSSLTVADFWSTKPFLSDHYGNHINPGGPVLTNERDKTVYAFLDGHVAYRAMP
ncbi:hypothetical protein OPIT5_30175 [Opitutaceae bacterium TAV5]|nr:hypothetical protein OPIT5_30175 [Opitutaceae bacterium TAV5]